jgi:pimeloyl-ACP methyl ester carboxylesterase
MPDIATTEVPLGDLTFTVDQAGPADGPPVLMLHGFPQTRRAWRSQMGALSAAGFRCVAPDQRGYSAGARPSETSAYVATNMVADAFGIMTALGHPTFHLVGHDWGGQIAWLMAASQPERLRSFTSLSRPHPAAFARALTTDSAQAGRSGHHRTLQQEGAAAAIRADDMAGLRTMFAGQGVPAETAQAYIATLSEPGAIEAAIAWYKAGAAALRAADVPPIGLNTLFIWGDADATVGRAAAEGTAAFVTGAYRFEAIPGAGHFLTDQVPEVVNGLLVGHLGAVGEST